MTMYFPTFNSLATSSVRVVRFDMDGVVAGFDADYTRRTGVKWDHHQEWTKERKWAMLQEHPFFFRDLPWVHGSRAMFDFVNESEGVTKDHWIAGICSCASTHIDGSAIQKREWLSRELPHLPQDARVEVIEHNDKWKYLRPGDILVDDYTKHTTAWEERGGIGIVFPNAVENVYASVDAINELQKHLQTPPEYLAIAIHHARNGTSAAADLFAWKTI